ANPARARFPNPPRLRPATAQGNRVTRNVLCLLAPGPSIGVAFLLGSMARTGSIEKCRRAVARSSTAFHVGMGCGSRGVTGFRYLTVAILNKAGDSGIFLVKETE